MSDSPWKAAQPASAGTVTRRGFTLGAVAAAATLMQPGAALARIPPEAGALPEQSSPATQLSPEAQAEADMKVREILRKYGSRLNDQQKAEIRRITAETQSGLEKMRAFALRNGDQPATVFQIYRGADAKGGK